MLVSLKWPEKARDQDPEAEDPYRQMVIREKAPTTPAVLEEAGMKFALYSDGIDAPRDFRGRSRRRSTTAFRARMRYAR